MHPTSRIAPTRRRAALVALAAAWMMAPSPYAGLEERPIKALSAEQVAAYRAGEGMGLALAAELNGYPGPKHVLELAAELDLSPPQHAAVEEAWEAMHAEAVRLGEQIVAAEAALDAAFADRTISSEGLATSLEELGRLEGELRRAHLAAHLRVAAVLSPEQIAAYDRLRGYGAPGHGGHDPSMHHPEG